jgi:type IV secretory pathway VirJ component
VKRLLAVALLLLASNASFAETTGQRCQGIADVRGLPLIELSAKRVNAKHHRFAIMLTGDGGWRRIDVRVTNRFREEGLPVVGFLTPEYFSTRRTADESACALERVIRFYKTLWKCDRVLLIGYSRGADILPFMLSRLPAEVRASVDVVALLGLEPSIDFRYHPSWIPFYHPKETQYPVLPEVQKLARNYRLLCFYGEKEKDSLCHALDPKMATIIRERGSHHFAGNYSGIAEAILRAVSEVAAQPAP